MQLGHHYTCRCLSTVWVRYTYFQLSLAIYNSMPYSLIEWPHSKWSTRPREISRHLNRQLTSRIRHLLLQIMNKYNHLWWIPFSQPIQNRCFGQITWHKPDDNSPLKPITVWCRYDAVKFSPKLSQKTPLSLVVGLNSHLYSDSVTVVICAISCCIGSRYNDIPLYDGKFFYVGWGKGFTYFDVLAWLPIPRET